MTGWGLLAVQPNKLAHNDVVVTALAHAVSDGGHGLSYVPGLIKRVITENCWQEREVSVLKEVARFGAFVEFVMAHPPRGLGTDLRTIRQLCADDMEAVDLLDRVEQRPASIHAVDNINGTERPTGTSTGQAIRRLRKDCPDLHARVLAGELSPHAAAVEAGFRPRTLTIPVDPERAARTILRHFDHEQISRLVYLLADATTEAS